MQDVAEQTGGLAFNNPKNIDKVYEQIEQDLRSQCILAYTPKAAQDTGKWRHIEIRTSRPGVKVRTQSGYRVL